MAYIVMAYIVMAHIVMACTVMAYIVMAYIVVAYVVLAHIVMTCTVMACTVMACTLVVLYSYGLNTYWAFIDVVHVCTSRHAWGRAHLELVRARSANLQATHACSYGLGIM